MQRNTSNQAFMKIAVGTLCGLSLLLTPVVARRISAMVLLCSDWGVSCPAPNCSIDCEYVGWDSLGAQPQLLCGVPLCPTPPPQATPTPAPTVTAIVPTPTPTPFAATAACQNPPQCDPQTFHKRCNANDIPEYCGVDSNNCLVILQAPCGPGQMCIGNGDCFTRPTPQKSPAPTPQVAPGQLRLNGYFYAKEGFKLCR